MRKILFIFSIILLAIFALNLFAQQKFLYVGVDKCKTCHQQERYGNQYGIWKEGPHAKALESLSSEKSLKYAKENGIEDPTKDPKCLNCHATYATVDKDLIDPKGSLSMEEGVSCESCHGPGSAYRKPSIMKKSAYDADFEAAHKAAMAVGLIEPTEQVCLTCHNENNPFHTEFDFKEKVAKVQHPTPYRKK